MASKKMLTSLLSKVKVNKFSTGSGISLSGIFPPIVTPFNANQSVAWDKLQHNVEKLNKLQLAGYLVHGSNGEFCYLSTEEKIEAVKRMTEAMAGAGCDAAVVVTPCYYKGGMTSEALEQHYKTVADSSPVPVVLYSVPANTTLDLPLQTVLNLAHHPNIVGIKDSGGDITKIAAMVHMTRDQDFQVIAGSAGFLLPALTVGAVGGICALANVLPEPVLDLVNLFNQQQFEEAQKLQHLLIGPNTAVTKQFGVAGLKQSMDWAGYHGGETRRPLLPLTHLQTEQLQTIFASSGFTF